MKDESALPIARRAVELALKKGATQAAAAAHRSREVEMQWRDGRVEKVSEATSRSLGVALYVDGRFSGVSTSDLRPDALEHFIEEAVSMAKILAKDPFRYLPDPKMYEGQSTLDLQLVDKNYDAMTPEKRISYLKAMESSARTGKSAERILSVTTGFSDSSDMSARVNSNGFEGEHFETSYWMSAEVSLKDDDDRRPEDSDFGGARFASELPAPETIGKHALERASHRLGSKKGESGKYPMLVDARSAGRLFGPMLGAISGGSIQQKRSFPVGTILNSRLHQYEYVCFAAILRHCCGRFYWLSL